MTKRTRDQLVILGGIDVRESHLLRVELSRRFGIDGSAIIDTDKSGPEKILPAQKSMRRVLEKEL